MKKKEYIKAPATIGFVAYMLTPKEPSKNLAGILELPKKVCSAIFGKSNLDSKQVKVEGVLGYLAFKTNVIFDRKNDRVFIPVSKEIAKIARMNEGDKVPVEITLIGEETETRVPADIFAALEAKPKALETWRDITPIARRDWIFWLIDAKQEQTRKRRIEKAVSMLSGGKRRVCCFAGITWFIN